MTSYGLPSDPGKYCIVVNYVVFEANKKKIKFKPNNFLLPISCQFGVLFNVLKGHNNG